MMSFGVACLAGVVHLRIAPKADWLSYAVWFALGLGGGFQVSAWVAR